MCIYKIYVYFKIENIPTIDKYQIMDSNCFQCWTCWKGENCDSCF